MRRKLLIVIKTGDKEENIVKTVTEKSLVKYRVTRIRIIKIASQTLHKGKNSETTSFNLLKEKKVST